LPGPEVAAGVFFILTVAETVNKFEFPDVRFEFLNVRYEFPDVRSFTGKYYFILFRFGGLKSRIFITAGHQPAERMCILSNCLKGRTVICTWRPAFQAASQERRLIRGSMTRGYANQVPPGLAGFRRHAKLCLA
ncbi:MAG: hypothetical protein LBL04_17295, partial [Bacteroidales bacterium]|jgi:hypothetical protein|nr:hypothetical protein [Bacteroidales bacterium]